MNFVNKNAGKLIRDIRKQKAMTQTGLAEQLHYNLDTIVNWERGYTSPSLKALADIAEHFGVPISSFLNKSKLSQKDIQFLKSRFPVGKKQEVTRMLKIGKRLRSIRVALKDMQKKETEKKQPAPIEYLLKMTEEIGDTVESFLNSKTPKTAEKKAGYGPQLSKQEEALLRLWRKASPKLRQATMGVLRSMIKPD